MSELMHTDTTEIEPDKLLHKDLTYKIIGICFKVHGELGCGFPEKIYQRAIVLELKKAGLAFVEEKFIRILYQAENIGSFRLDLAVEEKVILELKAVDFIPKIFREKLLSYLKATPYEVGLLINFGRPRLEYERIVRMKHPSV